MSKPTIIRFDLWHNPECHCTAVPNPSKQGQWVLYTDIKELEEALSNETIDSIGRYLNSLCENNCGTKARKLLMQALAKEPT